MGDGFLADAVLDEWKRTGIATVSGTILTLSDGRRFTMTDGLRILGRRNGDSDPYGLTGRILTLRSILRRGGLLSPDGVRLGAAIYDVGFGVITELVIEAGGDVPSDSDLVPTAVRTRSSVPPNARP
ncbi:MAG: hypothetical protein JNK04_26305 [Myxococcales bacterium]|nr:hypothetical protein [Myxococcales bacterium]